MKKLTPVSRPGQKSPGEAVRPLTPDDVNDIKQPKWKPGTPRPFQAVHTFKK